MKPLDQWYSSQATSNVERAQVTHPGIVAFHPAPCVSTRPGDNEWPYKGQCAHMYSLQQFDAGLSNKSGIYPELDNTDL